MSRQLYVFYTIIRLGDDLLDELTQNSAVKGAVKNADWDNAVQYVDLLMKQIKV